MTPSKLASCYFAYLFPSFILLSAVWFPVVVSSYLGLSLLLCFFSATKNVIIHLIFIRHGSVFVTVCHGNFGAKRFRWQARRDPDGGPALGNIASPAKGRAAVTRPSQPTTKQAREAGHTNITVLGREKKWNSPADEHFVMDCSRHGSSCLSFPRLVFSIPDILRCEEKTKRWGGRKEEDNRGNGRGENSEPRTLHHELLQYACFPLTSVLILLSLVLFLSFSSFLWSMVAQGLLGVRR